MIDKVQETHLYKWLCEKNSEFLGQVNEAIRYAETMLPLVSKVFADYTVHGIRHSKATYAEIKDYVLKEHGLKVSNERKYKCLWYGL